jgi:hypothetical protein
VEKSRRSAATLAAFCLNGLVHNLVINLLQRRWDFPLPFTFTAFGLLTVMCRRLEEPLRMDKWPRVCHLALNIAWVIMGFDLGFYLNELLGTISHS